MDYGVRYVAFLDILGFAAVVSDMGTDATRRDTILRLFHDLTTRTGSLVSAERPLVATAFSDSIVLSGSPTKDGLVATVMGVHALAWQVARSGLLLRGGITKGQLHHDGRVVVGDGLIAAYRLESQAAYYPRIVVADELATEVTCFDESSGLREMMRLDADGLCHLHVLADPSRIHGYIGLDSMNVAGYEQRLCDYREAGQASLDRARTPRDFSRSSWFAAYFNRHITTIRSKIPAIVRPA